MDIRRRLPFGARPQLENNRIKGLILDAGGDIFRGKWNENRLRSSQYRLSQAQ